MHRVSLSSASARLLCLRQYAGIEHMPVWNTCQFGTPVPRGGFSRGGIWLKIGRFRFVVWAAPVGCEAFQKGGGRSPPPFWKAVKPPGAAQTLKTTDCQPNPKPPSAKPPSGNRRYKGARSLALVRTIQARPSWQRVAGAPCPPRGLYIWRVALAPCPLRGCTLAENGGTPRGPYKGPRGL